MNGPQKTRKRAWEETVSSSIEDVEEVSSAEPPDSENGSMGTVSFEIPNSTLDLVRVSTPTESDQTTDSGTTTFLTIYLEPFFYNDDLINNLTLNASSITLQAAFIFFHLVSILNAFAFLKVELIFGDSAQHKLKYFVFVGYAANELLFRCYFFCVVFCCNYNGVLEMMQTMKSWKTTNNSGILNKTVRRIVGVLYFTAILLGISWPIFSAAATWGWKVDEIVLYRSFDFALKTVVWKPRNLSNDTELLNAYGTNITGKTLCMAFAGAIFETFGYIQKLFISSISLVSALTMYYFAKDFLHLLKSEESCNFNDIYEAYKKLRCLSKQLDRNFGLLLQLLHVEYLLFCAYFLFSHIVDGSLNSMTFIRVIYMLKLICFYVISSKASTVNATFREWIHKTFPGGTTGFIEDSTHVTTLTILDQLTSDPIGVGSSMFFIDRAFIWKFSSVVGSYLLFFAETTELEN